MLPVYKACTAVCASLLALLLLVLALHGSAAGRLVAIRPVHFGGSCNVTAQVEFETREYAAHVDAWFAHAA